VSKKSAVKGQEYLKRCVSKLQQNVNESVRQYSLTETESLSIKGKQAHSSGS